MESEECPYIYANSHTIIQSNLHLEYHITLVVMTYETHELETKGPSHETEIYYSLNKLLQCCTEFLPTSENLA